MVINFRFITCLFGRKDQNNEAIHFGGGLYCLGISCFHRLSSDCDYPGTVMSLLWFFFIFLAAVASGNTLLEWISRGNAKMREAIESCFVYRLGFAGGIGFGLLAYGVFVIGILGVLNQWTLMSLAVFLAILGFFSIRSIRFRSGFKISFHTGILYAILGLVIVLGLMDVLTPEISNDSLCYHLTWPKYFLEAGRIGYFDYDPNSLYPFLMEMLYTFGLGLGGAALAKSMHFATGLIACFAIYGFSRKYLAKEYSLIAVLGFLLSPVVLNQWGITYVEVGLAAFSVLALFSFLEWLDNPSPRWAILSGIFIGFALSVKLLGLMTLAIIGFGFLINLLKKNGLKSLIAFSVSALVFSFVWYLRMYQEYKNPVYPYFNSLFGLPLTDGRGMTNYDVAGTGMGAGLIQYLLMPWNITMHPQRFEGLGAQIGVLFLAFVPASFLAIREFPVVKRLLIIVLGYLTIWFFLAQNSRFLVPIIPFLAILVAFAFMELMRQGFWIRTFAILPLIAIFALNTSFAAYNNRNLFPVVTGKESPEAFLLRTERSYQTAQWVNQNLPKDSKILNVGEVRVYYFDRHLVREGFYPHKTDLDSLKKERFTHVLFSSKAGSPVPSKPVHELESSPGLEKIYQFKYISPDKSETWDYRIYEIK